MGSYCFCLMIFFSRIYRWIVQATANRQSHFHTRIACGRCSGRQIQKHIDWCNNNLLVTWNIALGVTLLAFKAIPKCHSCQDMRYLEEHDPTQPLGSPFPSLWCVCQRHCTVCQACITSNPWKFFKEPIRFETVKQRIWDAAPKLYCAAQ